MSWTKLACADELPPGALLEAEHEGQYYALCNVDGEVRALLGVCPHNGGPLGEGTLNGGLIACPWHMWEFDSATGVCAFNDNVKVPVYPVRIERGDILVNLPE